MVCKAEVRVSVGVIGVITRTNHIIASADAQQKGCVCCRFWLFSAFNTTKLLHLVGEIIECDRRRPREPGQKLVVKLESTLIP